jgi:hypothetical protein
MALNTEQKQLVTNWVVAGDSLSTIQKKIIETFKLSMTYMDVRFLVDDLNLMLKDAPAKKSTDLSQPSSDTSSAELESNPEDEIPPDALTDTADDTPRAEGSAIVTVDKITLIPGAIASGTVAFSDGVTGKWIIDNQGRPGFTEISKPDYSPRPEDAQAFMRELSAAMQSRGY